MKRQDLFYRMTPTIDSLLCGQIISKRWVNLLRNLASGYWSVTWPATNIGLPQQLHWD
jgi:hypothetical protein